MAVPAKKGTAPLRLTKDCTAEFTIKASGDSDSKNRSVTVRITTDAVDRVGDIIRPAGLQIDQYKKNPVVLWNHKSSIPIARATSLAVDKNGITAEAEFPPVGVSQKADEVYGLIQHGIVNAASVGIIPLKYDWLEGDDAYGFDITESELLEYSFVSIPANPEALISQRSAMSDAIAPAAPKCKQTPQQRARIIKLQRAKS